MNRKLKLDLSTVLDRVEDIQAFAATPDVAATLRDKLYREIVLAAGHGLCADVDACCQAAVSFEDQEVTQAYISRRAKEASF